jgi:hypothetical protein
MVVYGGVFFDRKKKIMKKINAKQRMSLLGLILCGILCVICVKRIHQIIKPSGTPVPKVEQTTNEKEEGFDVKGRINVSLEK